MTEPGGSETQPESMTIDLGYFGNQYEQIITNGHVRDNVVKEKELRIRKIRGRIGEYDEENGHGPEKRAYLVRFPNSLPQASGLGNLTSSRVGNRSVGGVRFQHFLGNNLDSHGRQSSQFDILPAGQRRRSQGMPDISC